MRVFSRYYSLSAYSRFYRISTQIRSCMKISPSGIFLGCCQYKLYSQNKLKLKCQAKRLSDIVPTNKSGFGLLESLVYSIQKYSVHE